MSLARIPGSPLLDKSACQYWDGHGWQVGDEAAAVPVALTGPWSGPRVLVAGADYPALYGGFIDPLHNDGRDLYFTLSQWGPYNVFWMHTTLKSETGHL